MERGVSQSQKTMSNTTCGGNGNAKQRKTPAKKTRSDAARSQNISSAVAAEPPPPYQPPSYSPNMPNFAYPQMLPNTGYQTSPFAMQQAIGQPLQITLQIQQPSGYLMNAGLPGMFQPPPFGNVPNLSFLPPAATLQPQGGNNTHQQPTFNENSSYAQIRDEVARKSASGEFGRAFSATAKDDKSSVRNNEKFISRDGQGQRCIRQHRGRGQQTTRSRGGSTDRNVSSVRRMPASTEWGASGCQSNEPVHSESAGIERHQTLRGRHGCRGQRSAGRRGTGHRIGVVSAENQPSFRDTVDASGKSISGSVPSHYLQRGFATRKPLARRNVQPRDCVVPIVGCSNISQGSSDGNDVSKSQLPYTVEEKSASELTSNAEDWEDVETESIADTESLAGMNVTNDFEQPSVTASSGTEAALSGRISDPAVHQHQHSHRGRGKGGRGKFRGRWISDTSRNAIWVQQVINNNIGETDKSETASDTEQSEASSVTDDSEWVDEDVSETNDAECQQNRKIKLCSTNKRGRGRVGALASRRLIGRQKISVCSAGSKNSVNFVTAAVECSTNSVTPCNLETDDEVIQKMLPECTESPTVSPEGQIQPQHPDPPNLEKLYGHVTPHQKLAAETEKDEDVPQKLTKKQRQRKQQSASQHGEEQECKTPLENCEKLRNADEQARVNPEGQKAQKKIKRANSCRLCSQINYSSWMMMLAASHQPKPKMPVKM